MSHTSALAKPSCAILISLVLVGIRNVSTYIIVKGIYYLSVTSEITVLIRIVTALLIFSRAKIS